jgi:hypothetical protein
MPPQLGQEKSCSSPEEQDAPSFLEERSSRAMMQTAKAAALIVL